MTIFEMIIMALDILVMIFLIVGLGRDIKYNRLERHIFWMTYLMVAILVANVFAIL